MGSPETEKGRGRDEGPQHRVAFAQPFAVGKYEVTFSEWDACVADRGCSHNPSDEGWGRGRRPVIDVSFNDAKQYTDWLSNKTGKDYRLLSEAEWEYAARGQTKTSEPSDPFSTGETISYRQANYDANFTYGSGQQGAYRQKTTDVGSFQKNAFGLYDMHGNVWEWVQDCYRPSYEGAPSDGSPVLSAPANCAFFGRRLELSPPAFAFSISLCDSAGRSAEQFRFSRRKVPLTPAAAWFPSEVFIR